MRPEIAREVLVTKALALIGAERVDDHWADRDAHIEYCQDAVDVAAKDLADALATEKQ
jgi:hypothetical protein